jgi:hydrogenase nickel incorporation protein HypB
MHVPSQENSHDHSSGHNHSHSNAKNIVSVEQDILMQNNLLAERNKGYFDAKNILANIFFASK